MNLLGPRALASMMVLGLGVHMGWGGRLAGEGAGEGTGCTLRQEVGIRYIL
jgi:hypothetical protein